MENRNTEPSVEPPQPEQVAPLPDQVAPLPDQVAPLPPSTTTRSSLPQTTARSSLLQELQNLWLEIGESDNKRVKMMQELERECLDIYNKKVEETRKYRAELQRSLAEADTEITSLMSALGEQVSCSWKVGSLKHRISTVKPVLEDLRMKKDLRLKESSGTLTQIAGISSHIAGNDYSGDLTQTNSDGLGAQYLQNEKAVRLQKVNSYISAVQELSEIMPFDFSEALSIIFESLTGFSKNISDDTLTRLTELVESLKKEKHQRLLQLQVLVRTMHELWELMKTPTDERRRFDHISSLLSHAADDALEKGCLGLDIVREAEDEVERLNALKESMVIDRIKELVVFNTAQQRLTGEQVLLPGEQLAPMVNRDTQGSSCNDQEIVEAEANLFIEQALQEMEGMKKGFEKAGEELAGKYLEDIRKLIARCCSLPEIEEHMVATHGTKVVGLAKQFFLTVVKSGGCVDKSGGDAYERHSLERSRQRRESRDKEESEERRGKEEETEERKLVNYSASTSGRK